MRRASPARYSPADKLASREPEIHASRGRKLEAAREQRRWRRQVLRTAWDGIQRKASLGPGAAMSTPGLRERPEKNRGAAAPLSTIESETPMNPVPLTR